MVIYVYYTNNIALQRIIVRKLEVLMSNQINLKEIERKAFRSTFQDGLRDMHYGLIVICMSVFIYRPSDGYNIWNILLALFAALLANYLFKAGKRFIPLPRMGQVRFGVIREKKKKTMAITLVVIIILQVGLLGLTVLGWVNPVVGEKVNNFLRTRNLMDLMVAAIGSFIVGLSMMLIAYFSDFPRGYYIAVLMSLAVFLMIYLNQPIYPIIIGGLIFTPGLVLFINFLKKYPIP